jgi:uncharacterized glyoxalase superfamily protein PhnB
MESVTRPMVAPDAAVREGVGRAMPRGRILRSCPEATDRTLDLGDVVGREAVELAERCADAATVEARYARVLRFLEAGARIPIPLRDTDYGSHEFGCLDPEGNYWGFGTYAPA